jgi:hypothetical protein
LRAKCMLSVYSIVNSTFLYSQTGIFPIWPPFPNSAGGYPSGLRPAGLLGALPYILRHDREEVPDDKQGNLPKTFKLVGEAYIHGLSDGQGIAHMKNPESMTDWRVIQLI